MDKLEYTIVFEFAVRLSLDIFGTLYMNKYLNYSMNKYFINKMSFKQLSTNLLLTIYKQNL